MSDIRPKAYRSLNPIDQFYFGTVEKSLQESAYHGASLEKPFNTDDLYKKKGDLSIYEEMLKDDQVSVGTKMKKDLILTSGWDLVPGEDGQEEIIDDLFCALTEDPDIPFESSLEEMLTAYDYGYSISEKVFKKRPNGFLTLRFIKTRHPDTWLIETDKYGNITEYKQRGTQNDITVNPKSLIHLVNNRRFQNPYGESDLRAAYAAWFTKRQIIRYYGIFLEKAASPTPIARYGTDAPSQAITDIHNAIKKFQAKTALTIPKEIEVEFLESKGNTGDAYIKGINIMNMMIGRSLLVPDLLGITGSETGGGSFSLGQEHIKLFFKHIDRRRRELEDLINFHIIKPIIVGNFGFLENFPKFQFKPLIEEDNSENLKSWLELAKLNIYEPTDEEINYFRSQVNFPESAIERKEEPDLGDINNGNNLPNNNPLDPLNNQPNQQPEIEVTEDQKKDVFSRKDYIRFTEDMTHFVYIVRDMAEFVPGSVEDRAVERGVILRMGTLASSPILNENIQSIFFSKSILTLEQASNWIRANVSPIVPDLTESERLDDNLDDKSIQNNQEEMRFSVFKPTTLNKRVDFKMIKNNLDSNLANLQAQLTPLLNKIMNRLLEDIEKKKIVQSGKFDKIDSLKITSLAELKSLLKGDLRNAFMQAKRQAKSELFSQSFGEPLPSEDFLKFLDQETFEFIGDWEYRLSQKTKIELRKAIKDGTPLNAVQTILDNEGTKLAQDSLDRYARTKFTEVMNRGRLETFQESGIVQGYQYSAVLDSQTTPICRGLHDKFFAAGTEPIPPAHFNCRSILIPVTKFESFEPTKKIGKQDVETFIKDNLGKGFSKR